MEFTKDLTDVNLATFLELFRRFAAANRSRFFLDLLFIVEREAIARHKTTAMGDYSDRELFEACEGLSGVADAMRKEGKTDDAADLSFILVALASAISEVGRRRIEWKKTLN